MDKDWLGNKQSAFSILGARVFAQHDRAKHDYYATPPEAVEELLKVEKFTKKVWECACGEGHISKVLKAHGYEVISTDLIDRGFGEGYVDFLKTETYFSYKAKGFKISGKDDISIKNVAYISLNEVLKKEVEPRTSEKILVDSDTNFFLNNR